MPNLGIMSGIGEDTSRRWFTLMSRRLFCLLLAVCSVQATSVAFAQLPRYWWSRGCGGGGAFFAPASFRLER